MGRATVGRELAVLKKLYDELGTGSVISVGGWSPGTGGNLEILLKTQHRARGKEKGKSSPRHSDSLKLKVFSPKETSSDVRRSLLV